MANLNTKFKNNYISKRKTNIPVRKNEKNKNRTINIRRNQRLMKMLIYLQL